MSRPVVIRTKSASRFVFLRDGKPYSVTMSKGVAVAISSRPDAGRFQNFPVDRYTKLAAEAALAINAYQEAAQ